MAWTTTTQTALGLRWNASTDNVGVTGYRIYRNGTQVGTTTTATTYTVTGLACGTTYSIGLTAVDAAGNQSDRAQATGSTTTSACSAPVDTTAPTAPGNLAISAGAAAGSIQLDWSASTDNSGSVSYEVFKDGIKVGNATGTNYTFNGITDCSTAPELSVRAVDAAGNGSARIARTIRCTWS